MTFRNLILALALLAAPAAAQQPERLTVGVVERPPFATRAAPEVWTGLAVDLWRLVAETEEVAYDLQPLAAEEAAELLASGAIDVALAIDATAALEARTDVIHPFYVATLGVARPPENRLLRVAHGVLSFELLRVVATLALLLLGVGALVWLLERRRNGEQFHPSPLRGLGDGFWWAGVTLTTIGYGDKAPATFAGRAVAMLWMLAGLAVSASLTAAVVTAANDEHAAVTLPDDLRGQSLGARAGSGAAAYLERLDLDYRALDSAESGLMAVEAGLLDRYLDAAPTLRALRAERGLEVGIATTALDPHYVAMAVRSGSPLAERLDRAVLARAAGPGWPELVRQAIPEE